MKIPPLYKEIEPFLRKIISNSLNRGKIEFSLFIESERTAESSLMNREVASLYYNEFKTLNESWGENPADYLSLVLRMPEVLNSETSVVEQAEIDDVLRLSKEACDMVISYRKKDFFL